MSEVTLIQTTLDATTGYLEINVAGAKPFLMSYSPNGVSANSKVAEVVKVLRRISDIEVQLGGSGFAANLPTTHEGEVQLAIAKEMGFSIVTASIVKALDIQGSDEGSAYSLQAQVSQNTVAIYLNSALGLAQTSVNIPQFVLILHPQDDQHVLHEAKISFPGATGSLSLDNSITTLAVQALKLNASDITVDVDGQNALHGISDDQIDASVKMVQGDGTITFAQQFSAQVIFSANPLINQTGMISGAIAQGTEIVFPHSAEQAKVLAGSIDLFGTLDFAGSMNATVGSCIEGQKNAPLFLQTAICKF